jgi:hypothetical protein
VRPSILLSPRCASGWMDDDFSLLGLISMACFLHEYYWYRRCGRKKGQICLCCVAFLEVDHFGASFLNFLLYLYVFSLPACILISFLFFPPSSQYHLVIFLRTSHGSFHPLRCLCFLFSRNCFHISFLELSSEWLPYFLYQARYKGELHDVCFCAHIFQVSSHLVFDLNFLGFVLRNFSSF